MTLEQIDAALVRSRKRQREYEGQGDLRSAEIEENVQDRLLRDRRSLTELVGP